MVGLVLLIEVCWTVAVFCVQQEMIRVQGAESVCASAVRVDVSVAKISRLDSGSPGSQRTSCYNRSLESSKWQS